MPACQAITLKGTNCTRRAIEGEIYCKQHLKVKFKDAIVLKKEKAIKFRETEFREYIPGEEVTSFFSNAKQPLNKLSNFAFISDGLDIFGEIYISSEHAFQSKKYLNEDKTRFNSEGIFSNVREGFISVFSEEEADNKKNYWLKKGNVGILAKMATNEKVGKRLGLKRDFSFKSTYQLWEEILLAKFRKEEFKNILLSTGDSYLLEFSRDAQYNAERGVQDVWGGIVDDDILYGDNLMGKYLMKIRDIVRAEK